MLFKDVIGHQEVKQHLVEMVQHSRISHALLFLGKEGSGALPLAMAFANYVSLLPNSPSGGGQGEAASLFGEPVEVKLPSTADEADAGCRTSHRTPKLPGWCIRTSIMPTR
jgi:DNA polymerase-3 subunit delta'